MSLSASSSSTVTSSWCSKLDTKQLKQLTKPLPAARACIERSDLEDLVRAHYQSLDQAQLTLTTLDRLQQILRQDRSVLNFIHYETSLEHKKRLAQLAQTAPELYDNPLITLRSKWFTHTMYRKNSQMPPYHIHFRQELQSVLRALHHAWASGQLNSIQTARVLFRECMSGLHGHVQIEEYACFPAYARTFPNVNVKFLYEDHVDLHKAEVVANKALDKAVTSNVMIEPSDLIQLVRVLLQFDDHLLTHLGEEEEIVVPLSLTDRKIYF
jgi:hypothetical protein